MTCHLSFTKISDRTAPRGATSSLSGPAADSTRGKIINLPERFKANLRSQTGAASVAPSFIPATRSPAEGAETQISPWRMAVRDTIAVVFVLPFASAIVGGIIVGLYSAISWMAGE